MEKEKAQLSTSALLSFFNFASGTLAEGIATGVFTGVGVLLELEELELLGLWLPPLPLHRGSGVPMG